MDAFVHPPPVRGKLSHCSLVFDAACSVRKAYTIVYGVFVYCTYSTHECTTFACTLRIAYTTVYGVCVYCTYSKHNSVRRLRVLYEQHTRAYGVCLYFTYCIHNSLRRLRVLYVQHTQQLTAFACSVPAGSFSS